RAEAEVARVARLGGIGGAAFSADEASGEAHGVLFIARALAPGVTGNPVDHTGCRDFTGPVPQSLLMTPPFWSLHGCSVKCGRVTSTRSLDQVTMNAP